MNPNYTDQAIDPETGLLMRERAFVDFLVSDPQFNQTRAYLRAGYPAGANGEARKRASDLAKQPDVNAYLNECMSARAERLGINRDRILLELAVVCYARRTDFILDPVTGEITVKPGVPEEMLGAIASTDVTKIVRIIPRHEGPPATETEYRAKFTLHPKMQAAKLLCQHLGLVSVELPPLEVLLNRLPPEVAKVLRRLLSQPRSAPAAPPGPEEIPG